ncbi:MAG: hypothetical protein HZA88_07080 [Verrucomicrobia bacterium]|nr:hypothetical protein [Verrucomicrobiota bacterium]
MSFNPAIPTVGTDLLTGMPISFLHVDAAGNVSATILPPTSDPHVAGAIWNDNGVLSLSNR